MKEFITCWNNEKFSQIDEPFWWPDAMKAVFGGAGKEKALPNHRFGNDDAVNVAVYELLNIGHNGALVIFSAHGEGYMVWCPNHAQTLDLLTTRAPTWLSMPSQDMPDINRSLSDIRNAMLSYVRHGSGKHIRKFDGTNSTDEPD